MADQAAVKATGPGGSSPAPRAHANGSPGVVGSLAEFVNDVANLTELQAALVQLDVKDCVALAVRPLVLVVVGLVVVLGAVPVVLIGVADLLARAFNFSLGAALVLTGLVALAGAGLVAYVALGHVTKSVQTFRRSQEEFIRNLSWIRTVLVYSGRSFPKRGL